jgi:hypothetical protein
LQYYLGVYPEVLRKSLKTCEYSGRPEKIRIWDHLIRSKNVKNATAAISSVILKKNQFSMNNFVVHGLPIRKQ